MRRPARWRRAVLGWVFLNVLAVGAMPAVWFIAPSRTRWAWEFTHVLAWTAHDFIVVALTVYALAFAGAWVSFLDRPDDWL